MIAEHRYQIFQIKPGKPMPLAIDPDDPKGIKAIQAILRNQDKEEKARAEAQALAQLRR